ncbi:MAG: helix-hairpin-helix domain-containing protein [Deltaproteobacteria bacterium]|mgnify:CR=1 FL=1|nr:helix-hairpin-helix domain-containing protein [Deltaproteobacteria bacterium]RKX57558.1 MAG: DNA-binding protein [Thermodesulfobacteriota bacterium]MBW1947166.1 helix-hairpin-helix domain-containing protein [Deltaproteobacteria bacterium]MBW1966179.1 helix-hairpin-helix domain-containing protein [Deltaproteobacteria bacterium]MBW2097498.1 helix-hairpin-helix domain-containing protein [Deltaproteobacteria bacterium]
MLKGILCSIFLVLFLFISAFAAINLNTADKAALESISGIGPAKAAAIIKYRDAHGSFKSVDELLNVKGIGPKMLENIKGQVEITH